MNSYSPTRTIAAVATAPGEGGIAVIRISGKESLAIADSLFSGSVPTYKTHTLHFGQILQNGNVIDEVLLAVMKGPRSYTGEDTVEIHCHGGSLITCKVLEAVLEAGATPAGPGEFTYQAFMNGKLDLAQAEAVQALIGAKNDYSLKAAKEQLGGRLSREVTALQKGLLDTAAILEAWVDFPEEGLEFASKEAIIETLEKTLRRVDHLLSTFADGKKIHEGVKLALVGAPNAGKSSLMNALLGKEQAIVTSVPGTTRDRIEADLKLGGLHFQVTDTAGIRHTEEEIEKEGIRRSKETLAEADLILLLLDVSKPLTEEEELLIESAPAEKTLLVYNKIDLPHTLPKHQGYPISAQDGTGLSSLKEAITTKIWREGTPPKDQILLTSLRHKDALLGASSDLKTLIAGLHTSASPELLSADMRSALAHLSSIIGMDISEEILSSIFEKFCVGK